MDINDYKPRGRINNRHLISLMDYTTDEIYEILHLAIQLKNQNKKNIPHKILQGKTLALIFAKSSTRTRISFEMGMRQLGGDTVFLSTNELQVGRGESMYDTANVLSRMGLAGIMIRTFSQEDVVDLARYGNMPVVNGLTDIEHPCQALADILTIYEHLGRLSGVKIAYLGDGNNVTHSLMMIGAKLGMKVTAVCPEGYQPLAEITKYCQNISKDIVVTSDIKSGVMDADIIYTDVHFSMGQIKDPDKQAALMPYQVNKKVMELTGKKTLFMHCLPAHRGEEVTADVIDSDISVVFDEAENRLHAQKAILALLLSDCH